MSPFPNTRTKRRTVYAMLLVWFFALGSGWANACLLQERGTHWHEPSDDASPTVQAPRVSPGHVGADSDHAENAGLAKSACLKVCGDDTQTIVKLASSLDLGNVAMAPPMALTWADLPDAAEQANAWLELPDPVRVCRCAPASHDWCCSPARRLKQGLAPCCLRRHPHPDLMLYPSTGLRLGCCVLGGAWHRLQHDHFDSNHRFLIRSST